MLPTPPRKTVPEHSRAGDNKPLYLDHPQFEGFEVRQMVGRGKADVARTASTWHLEPFVALNHLDHGIMRGVEQLGDGFLIPSL
jgi:hypothetical protein